MQSTKSIDMAESFLKRASIKFDEAERQLKDLHHDVSINASQECIELSIKALFVLLTESYPKKHEFEDKEFERLLDRVPEHLKDLNFPRVYVLHKFWSGFMYTAAKYGSAALATGPEKLFHKEEAELAVTHAENCRFAGSMLLNKAKFPPKV